LASASLRQSQSGTTTSAISDSPGWIKTTLDKQVFKIGQPITAHIVMRVVGRHVFIAQDDYFHCFRANVISPSGAAMNFSDSGGVYYDDHTGGSSQRMHFDYGYTDYCDFPLDKLFDFSTKGYYRVSLSYCQKSWMKPEAQAAIFSPSLKIVPAITAGSNVLPLSFRQ
jgi:hypothetical protein